MRYLLLIAFFVLPNWALAEGTWSHESEVSIVTVDGNAESETTSAKQTTKYAREKDSLTAKAEYTESEQSGVTSARAWLAGLRYDRILEKRLSAFLGQTAKSDFFAGTVQEDLTDLGLSYLISKRDDQEWNFELGYQLSKTNYVDPTESESFNKARAYTKYSKTLSESVSASIFVEYTNAFEKGDDGADIYNLEAEPSIAVVMTSILSLKLKYNWKYQNYVPAGSTERVDTTFTTALVAKF